MSLGYRHMIIENLFYLLLLLYRDISGIEHYGKWGTYNVHDPAVMRVADTYYMYSTDAIYFQRRNNGERRQDIKHGNIQLRSSKDLVHWKFEGWAFDSIPAEAKQWVWDNNQNKGATNIWAPFPVQYGEKFRLYYCVSAFGMQSSYIGLYIVTGKQIGRAHV